MSTQGVRVGDVGTKITLHVADCYKPAKGVSPPELNLTNVQAILQIAHSGGVNEYEGVVDVTKRTVTYQNRESTLWPLAGIYTIMCILRWPSGDVFHTEDVSLSVK